MRWGCGRPHRADPELCRGRQGPREKRETGTLGHRCVLSTYPTWEAFSKTLCSDRPSFKIAF